MTFQKMFERHGWTVETLGENSFVAYNETYFIPFSINTDGTASAVSYLIDDKDAFIESWKKYTENTIDRMPSPIGYYAFKDWFSGEKRFMAWGRVANHDHSTFEIESWLKRLDERKRNIK